MNYRHAFHAGNFADVAKHLALVAILLHLRRKETAFAVIDTHAGRGLYDLRSDAAQRTGEARRGIGRLRGLLRPGAMLPDVLQHYLAVVMAAAPNLPEPGQITQPHVTTGIGSEDQPVARTKALVDGPVPAHATIIASSPEIALAERNARVKTKRPRKHGRERRAITYAGAPETPKAAVGDVAPIDELVALEAENRELKAALMVYLRRQNLELRSMLERFDAS